MSATIRLQPSGHEVICDPATLCSRPEKAGYIMPNNAVRARAASARPRCSTGV
jgi:hypothetical protein